MRYQLPTLTPFDCDRTCRTHATRDYCRFNPLFALIGTAPTVNSHTVKVKCELNDPRALEAACRALGWTWHGLKMHQLYSSNREHGHGFQPPSWRYPIVLNDAGTLAFDDYHGQWGNVADLETLKSAYLTSKIETSAAALGWQTERTTAGITVYHPEGGRLDISNAGVCDTSGFTGGNCHTAREALGLATDGAAANKTEIDHMPAVIQQAE